MLQRSALATGMQGVQHIKTRPRSHTFWLYIIPTTPSRAMRHSLSTDHFHPTLHGWTRHIFFTLFTFLLMLTTAQLFAADQELITSDSSFEDTASSWSPYAVGTGAGTSADILGSPDYVNYHTGTHYAYLGDKTPSSTHARGVLRYMNITLPSGTTTVTLSFWLNVTSAQTTRRYDQASNSYFDTMDAELRLVSSPDTILVQFGDWSNMNRDPNDIRNNYLQQQSTRDVTAYAGQAVFLMFYAQTDDSQYTTFRIDDVSLKAKVDSSPNLVPYTPPGWSDSIVISKARGDQSGSAMLFSTDDLFLNWAIMNNGQGPTSETFFTDFLVDSTVFSRWYTDVPFAAGSTTWVEDSLIGRLPTGKHTLVLRADSTGTIPGEHDWTYTKDVVIYPAPPSEFQCAINNTSIHLTWKNNAPDATGCRITRTRNSTGEKSAFILDQGVTVFDDNTVVRDIEYCYTVVATAGDYASPESNACCAKVGGIDPPLADIAVQSVASPGALVHFVNKGSRGDNYRYSWSTDDAQSASSVDADFRLYAVGKHRVELRVSSPGSGYADATASAYVDIQPQIVGNGNGGSSGNVRVHSGADPVNLASGNYIYSHRDLKLPGIGMSFEFTRYYNSRAGDQAPGPFGYGWTFTPSITVFALGTNAVVSYGDGHSETHSLTDSGYVGSAGVFDRLVKQDDSTWLVITKNQTTNIVDSIGRLLRVVDRNGNAVQLAYDPDNGRLATAVDTAGRTTTLQPHAKYPSLVGAIEDVMGRRVVFDYDEHTNLIAVINPRQHTTRFAYDDRHQMTDAWDNRGNLIVHNDYDTNLNVVFHQYDAYTNHVYFSFDFTNRVTVQTNGMGGISMYKFDSNLLLTNVTDEATSEQSFAYDDSRNRVYVRDRNGNETWYTYDERGNVTRKRDPLSNVTTIEYDARNNPTRRVDALGNSTVFSYDDHGNLRATTNALGLSTAVQYDAHGLPLVLTDARGSSTTNQFDAQGNLVAVIDTRGNTNWFGYDEIGRKTLQIDALGRTNSFTYDGNNNLLLSVNALGFTNTFGYDANNNRVSVQDSRGAITLTAFDLKDRVVSVTDATNHIASNAYDALDRKVSAVDARSNATGYAYDPIGNLVAVTNALLEVAQFAYDNNQNQISITDPAGNTTAKTYDALNRLIFTVDPLTHTNATGYDALGRVVSTTNANGQVTTFNFDAIGRLTNVIDAAQQPIYFEYDANGNRLRTTDPNGHTSTNVFDDLNRLVEQWDLLGHKTTFFYDAVGNLTNKVTPNGDNIAYTYDALNRLTNVTYPDHSTVAFAYDSVSNRTNMVDWSGQTGWQYDLLNHLVAVTDSFGRTVAYQYDQNGNRTALVYPGGNTVTYGYDPLNRMAGFTNWLGGVTSYSYDNRGNLVTTTNANGTTVAYAYDLVGRLIGLTNNLPDGKTLTTYTLDLDPIGNHRQATFEQPLLPTFDNHINAYAYDSDDRLLSVDGEQITHDANGNLTSWGTRAFRYDFENRLIAHSHTNVDLRFSYDGLGNRIGIRNATNSTTGLTRQYVLDRASPLTQVLLEVDNNNTTAYYVYGIGLAQQLIAATNTYTYHFDSEGSTAALTCASATVTDAYAYDSFGSIRQTTGSSRQVFRYLGRYGILHDSPALYYSRARYFLPQLGRFLTKDLLSGSDRAPQTLSAYTYALNNPHVFSDVSGLAAQDTASASSSLGQHNLPSYVYYLDWVLPISATEQATYACYDKVLSWNCAKNVFLAGIQLVPADRLLKWGAKGINVVRVSENMFARAEVEATYSKLTGQGLYVLRDEEGAVKYIGRGNASARVEAHAVSSDKSDLIGQILWSNNLTDSQAKGLEQRLIDYFGGAFSQNPETSLLNRIRSFAPNNPNASVFESAVSEDLWRETLHRLGL